MIMSNDELLSIIQPGERGMKTERVTDRNREIEVTSRLEL